MKIVIKIGTNSLTNSDGSFNVAAIKKFSQQINELIKQNNKVVLVSSGAATAGLNITHKWSRKGDINYKQALCAIGQVELMKKWQESFGENGLSVAQLLYTNEDFTDSARSLNIRNTLFTLIDEGVIPIVNENDSVSYEEIAIGDNDNLSAATAILWNADLLVLISDIDGIYTDDPKTSENAEKIDQVCDISELKTKINIGNTNEFGTGGIRTKLEAAEKVNKYGINCVLTNSIENIDKGTTFIGK